MAEMLEDNQKGSLESSTIGIYRTAATVKGGRRFSFGALVVVGDRQGNVGLGYSKAPNVPSAIEKAQKDGKKHLVRVQLNRGTITHEVSGRFGGATVRLIPASPGTGVIAGGTARAVLDLAGVKDVLSKAYGSTNQKNLSKAVLDALLKLRTRETISELRGVELDKTVVDEKIEIGEKFAPTPTPEGTEKARAPINELDEKARSSRGKGRGGKGGGGGGGNRGRSREREGGGEAEGTATTQTTTEESPAAEQPATESGVEPSTDTQSPAEPTAPTETSATGTESTATEPTAGEQTNPEEKPGG